MKRVFQITLMLVVALALGLPVVSFGTGPVALWHLDEGLTATTVSDSSGNGHDGTIYGGALPGQTGRFGNAMYFDGVDGYVEFGSSDGILDLNTFTMETWFKTSVNHGPYGTGSYEGRLLNLHRSDGGPSTAVSLYVEKDQIGLLYRATADHKWVRYPTNYWDDEWHHIAVTYDSTHWTFYYDGDPVDYFADTFGGFGGWPAYLATYDPADPGARDYNGYLDEVRLYDYALSPSEINDHAAGVGVYDVSINIKPGSDPNSINLCSGGVTPVTIWGSEYLDVNTIDISELVLASSTVKTVGKSDRSLCSIKDSGGPDAAQFDGLNPTPDGFPDLTCHFVTIALTSLDDSSTDSVLSVTGCDAAVGCTTGVDGYYVTSASDSVNIVKDCD